MCVRCSATPASFKWPGEHIYIGHQLKRAVTSRWPVFCVGIGTSGAGASVLPVTLHSEIAVGLSDIAAATSGTIGFTDAMASELPVTLDLYIVVALC